MRSYGLGAGLAALGHDVTLLASRSRPGLTLRSTVLGDVQHVELPDLFPHRIRHGGLSPIDTFLRSIWILNQTFDIVHGFDHRPAVLLPALVGQRLKGMTFISDWADLWGLEGIASERKGMVGTLLGGFDHYIEKWARSHADAVTAISTDLDLRLDSLGIPEKRRRLLPPGANLRLTYQGSKTMARSELGLPIDIPIAAFTGFAPYDKELLVDCVIALLKRAPNSMVISSGVVIQDLDLYGHQEGIEDRIIQYGIVSIEKMNRILSAADVLLLPYSNTPVNRGRFPNKFGDYIASGRPLVTHRTGDLGEIVMKEGLGVLAGEGPEEFAAAVIGLMNSPEETKYLGMNARRFAGEKWSWDLRARELFDFYVRIRS
jgi:glycosyltransferase involved in cell wall biosynthesis